MESLGSCESKSRSCRGFGVIVVVGLSSLRGGVVLFQ